ncbi:MAG: hypothetical protein HQL17_06830 [Candidatus Omnitrophica bacterium]|nr:hypothetical protein [Candidatus Omnitrophota bacterium]
MKIFFYFFLFLSLVSARPAWATYFPFTTNINIGIGTEAPQIKLQVGSGPAPSLITVTGNDAHVAGNLGVDGAIYGNGAALTNLSGLLVGMTPGYVPRSFSASQLVDSGIYQKAGGNIGLGTADPQALLDVVGQQVRVTSAQVRGRVNRPDNSGTAVFRWRTAGATNWELGQRTTASDAISLYSTLLAANLLTLTTAGNVGLGTVAPAAGLDIRRNGTQPPFMVSSAPAQNGDFLTVTSSGMVGLGTSNPQSLLQIGSYPGTVSASVFINNNNSSNTTYQLLTGSSVGSFINFAVTDAGNVGIGSAVPMARLHVGVAPAIVTGSSPQALVKGNMVIDGVIYGNAFPLTGLATLSGLTIDRIPLALSATSMGNSNVYQGSNGNIGIGTASPLAVLDINGAAGMRVNGALGDTVSLKDNSGALRLSSTQTAAAEMLLSAIDNNIYFQNTNTAGNIYLIGLNGATLTGNVTTALAGNLGINTAIPAAKLDVVGAGTATAPSFGLRDSALVSRVQVMDNGNVGIGTTADNLLSVGLGQSSRFNGRDLIIPSGKSTGRTPSNNALTVLQDVYGSSTTGIHAYRDGSSQAINGGTSWTPTGVDAALSVVSKKGNAYSAAVAAWSGLNFDNSAALVAGNYSQPYAFLGNNIGGVIYAASFFDLGIGTYAPTGMLEIEKSGAKPLWMVSSSGPLHGDRVTVSSAGNVGIGTSVPKAMLEIENNNTFPLLMLSSGTGYKGDYLTVTSAGNVGVGTSAPGGTLDIVGSTGGTLMKVAAYLDAGSTVFQIKNSTASAGWNLTGYGSGFAGRTNQFGFVYNTTNYVLITSGGNVSIGSSSPVATLEVERRGTTPVLMVSSSGSTPGDYFMVSSGGNVGIGSTAPRTRINGGLNLGAATGDETGYSFDFTTNKAAGDDTGLQIRMTDMLSPGVSRLIDMQVGGVSQFSVTDKAAYFSGNVGVGTIQPSAGLEIQRSAAITPFSVSSSALFDGDLLIVAPNGNVGVGGTVMGVKLGINGSVMFRGLSLANIEGEFVYDTPTHVYRYHDDTQWNDLSGGTITYSATLWQQAGTNLFYLGGNIGIGTSLPDNFMTLSQSADANGIKVRGFDDKISSYLQMNVNAAGDGQFKTTGNAFMDIAGNMGIGTTAPQSLLQIVGGSMLMDNNQPIQFRRASGSIRSLVNFNSSNDLTLDTGTSGQNMLFNAAGIERMRIPRLGNVGIGTSVPAGTLEVQLQAPTLPFFVSYPGAAGGYMTVTTNGNTGIGSVTPAGRLDIAGFGSGSGLSLATRDSTFAATAVIQDDGNVGFGTTAPGKRLVVYSANSQQLRLGYSDAFFWDITRASTGSLEYYSSDATAGIKMAMNTNGNLGVGTALPDAALSARTIGQNAVVNFYGATASTDYGAIQVSSGGGLSNPLNRPLYLQLNAGNVGVGTTNPLYLFQVGAAPTVIAGSSPIAAFKGNFEVDGDVYLANASFNTVRAQSEMIMRQTGDTQGNTFLTLHNRDTNEYGAVLETSAAAALLTELIFRTSSASRVIRFDDRVASVRTGDPSFHIGGVSADSPTLSVGDSYAAIGNMLRVGAYTVPGQTLSVTGSASFTGNVGIGTTSTAYILETGLVPATVPSGAAPAAAIDGDLFVDGQIYADGSALTGLTASSVNGLNAGYVPQASAAVSIVDGAIYQSSTGNIGIGTTAPAQALSVRGNTKVQGQLAVGTYALTDGATIAVNWDNGNAQYVTLGGNRQITFSNPAADTTYYLVLVQDATGTRTITSWPSVIWGGGVAPVLTTTATKADIVSCLYMSATYYCSVSQNF